MLQLFDLAGIYFRAFHAVPASTVGPHGRPVNSVRGTLDILARVIAEAGPTRAVACLDLDWRPAWRVDLIPTYKTHRVAAITTDPGVPDVEEAPDELSAQVPILLDILGAIGIATAGAPQCEADDVIGTLASTERRDPVEVVSGDRDLFQLVADGPPPIVVRYIGAGMSKAMVYDTAAVRTRFGVEAAGYVDYATLRGIPSDGLPGVAGIGEKTAAALISRYGSIEGILGALDDADSGLASGPRAKLAPARAYLQVAPAVTAVRRNADVTLSRPDVLPTGPDDAHRLTALAAEHGVGNSVRRLTTVLGFAEDSW